MSDWQRFNDQFRETVGERNARLAAARRKRSEMAEPQEAAVQYPTPTENLIAKLREAATDTVNTHPAHAMLMRAAANRLVEYFAAAEAGLLHKTCNVAGQGRTTHFREPNPMTISPQLKALLVLKGQNYIGEWGLPHYLGFHNGTHHFQLTNGDRVHVDLVLNRVGA